MAQSYAIHLTIEENFQGAGPPAKKSWFIPAEVVAIADTLSSLEVAT
jgi:hypothetical protein